MNIYILFGKKIFFAEKYGTNVRKNESKGSMRSKKDRPAKQMRTGEGLVDMSEIYQKNRTEKFCFFPKSS